MSDVSLGKCVVPEFTRSKMWGPWSGVGVYTFRDSEIAEWRHLVVLKCTGSLFLQASHFLVKAQEGSVGGWQGGTQQEKVSQGSCLCTASFADG